MPEIPVQTIDELQLMLRDMEALVDEYKLAATAEAHLADEFKAERDKLLANRNAMIDAGRRWQDYGISSIRTVLQCHALGADVIALKDPKYERLAALRAIESLHKIEVLLKAALEDEDENNAVREAWTDFVTKRPGIFENPSAFYQEMLRIELRHDDHPGPHRLVPDCLVYDEVARAEWDDAQDRSQDQGLWLETDPRRKK